MKANRRVTVLEDPTDLARKGADFVARSAAASAARDQSFTLAISGGSTPRPMHRMFAQEPYRSLIEWNRVRLFWVDERCVPPDDPESNFGAARKDFLDHLPIPAGQVHPMPWGLEPEVGASAYEKEIRRAFALDKAGYPSLDTVVLGMGQDGHVASLFPGSESLNERDRLVLDVRGGVPEVNRLTLTLPVLNRAKEILFMVSGERKAPVVKALLEDDDADLPAQRVQPLEGRVTWLLDKGAASMLRTRNEP